MQLRYDNLLIYYEPQYSLSKSAKWKTLKLSNLHAAKTYTGSVTTHTKKRISKAINLLLQSAERKVFINPITHKKEVFKLNFITLTISGNERKLSAKEGYSLLLKPFLQWLTKTHNVNTYIWKAELQRNGQLHYHITTTTWIHWSTIRNKWNYLLSKNSLLDNYQKKHKHSNANSTDVHKVYKIRNISAYLHKELTKSLQNIDSTTGKIWDCSNNIKGQPYFRIDFDDEHEKMLLRIADVMKLTETVHDQFILIKGTKHISKMILNKVEINDYAKYIDKLRRTKTLLS